MASLRKRPKSDFWVCCYTTSDGRRTQRSTGTADKDQAMMACRQWEGEARMEREEFEAAAMDSGRGKGRRIIWAAAVIAVLLQIGALLWFMNREPAPVSLLVELDASEQVPDSFMEQQIAKRHRWVRINEDALKAFDEKTWKFELNLFDDEKHLVYVAVYRKHYTGAKSVVGLVEDDLHTSVVLSRRDSRREAMAGSIALADGRRFMITHVEDGKHVVVEVDMSKMPPHGNHAMAPRQRPGVPGKEGQPEKGKGTGVGANDYRYGKPQTEFALKKSPGYPFMNSMSLARKMAFTAQINPENLGGGKIGTNPDASQNPNTGWNFYGPGMRRTDPNDAAGGGGTVLDWVARPSSPSRFLYHDPGVDESGVGSGMEFIDVMFVYEQALLDSFPGADQFVKLSNMQLKVDNLLEDTNFIFRRCQITLEVRQAIANPIDRDPATQAPRIDQNSLFLATARAWSGSAPDRLLDPQWKIDVYDAIATAHVDLDVNKTIGGSPAPAWRLDTPPVSPVWDSLAANDPLPPHPTWVVSPIMAIFKPLYETPDFNGKVSSALDWISDARNSLIYGDQYWPEPYINFPESFEWRLLPVALDTNASRDDNSIPNQSWTPMGAMFPKGLAPILGIEYTTVENPDIAYGPMDDGIFKAFNLDPSAGGGTLVSMYGGGGSGSGMDEVKPPQGANPTGLYDTSGENRQYRSRDDFGSVVDGPGPGGVGHLGNINASLPPDSNPKPNYYLRNNTDGTQPFDPIGEGVVGTIDLETDVFTLVGGVLVEGVLTSFKSSPGGTGLPLTIKSMNRGDPIWPRFLEGDKWTFHHSRIAADATQPTTKPTFAFDITGNILTRTAAFDTTNWAPSAGGSWVSPGLIHEGAVVEYNATLTKDRPLYIEIIDGDSAYLRTTDITTTGNFADLASPGGRNWPVAFDADMKVNNLKSGGETGGELPDEGIDTFESIRMGTLASGDQVFIVEGRANGAFPRITSDTVPNPMLQSPAITRNTVYDVYKWSGPQMSLHRIKDRTQLPKLTYIDTENDGENLVLEEAKSGYLIRVAGGGALGSDDDATNPPDPADSLLAYFPFDWNGTQGWGDYYPDPLDPSTTTWTPGLVPSMWDHNATIFNFGTGGGPGAPTMADYVDDQNASIDPTGSANGALSFKGNNYLTLPHPTFAASMRDYENMTFAAWIKTGTTHSKPGVIISKPRGKTGGIADTGLSLRLNGLPQNSAQVSLNNSETGQPPSVANTMIPMGISPTDGKWHHLVGTVEYRNDAAGSKIRVYVDGALVNEVAFTPKLNFSTEPITIGRDEGASTDGYHYFTGAIDDLRIYGAALTPAQVAQLYIAESTGSNVAAVKNAKAKAVPGSRKILDKRGAVEDSNKFEPKPESYQLIEKAQTFPKLQVGQKVISPKITGRRTVYRGLFHPGDRQKPEATARAFLASVSDQLKMKKDLSDLKLVRVKHSLATSNTHFQQHIKGIPVLSGMITVSQGPTGSVRTLHSQYFSGLQVPANKVPAKTFAQVLPAAQDAAGFKGKPIRPAKGKLYWYPQPDGTAKLVYKTEISSPQGRGVFLTTIDANSGEIMHSFDTVKNGNILGTRGDITAGNDSNASYVYWPNPWQTMPGPPTGGTGTLIPPGHAPAGFNWETGNPDDSNTTDLWDQRQAVILKGLDPPVGGVWKLKGQFVDLTAWPPDPAVSDSTGHSSNQSLVPGDANSTATLPVFNYARDNPHFEQVQVYHTIDSIQRYVHSLGFDDDVGSANGIYDTQIIAGANYYAGRNAYFSVGGGLPPHMAFGYDYNATVDWAEDGDIIAHEYGHGMLYDMNTQASLSMFAGDTKGSAEWGAMGEGFGDYLACSFFDRKHGSFIDDRNMSDLQVYGTIKIGDQTWMTENFRYSKGDTVGIANPGASGKYGRLYTWAEIQAGDFAPPGWHVPTDAEWKTLETFLGMTTADVALPPNGDLNNGVGYATPRGVAQNVGTQLNGVGSSSGMDFLPAGYSTDGAALQSQGDKTYLWVDTVDPTDAAKAFRRKLVTNPAGDDPASVYRFTNAQAGFWISVRLIKDSGVGTPAQYQKDHAAAWAEHIAQYVTPWAAGTWLRRVDGNKKWDTDWDGTNEVHANGEIWAAALWKLRGSIVDGNASKADQMILEGFMRTPEGMDQTMKDVALLIHEADKDLNPLNADEGVNGQVIMNAFNSHNITVESDYPYTSSPQVGAGGEAALRKYVNIVSVAAPYWNYSSPKEPGRFYFADRNATDATGKFHVRRVDGDGTLVTLLGNGTEDPDLSGPAISATIDVITDIAVDGQQRVYIAAGLGIVSDPGKVYRVGGAGSAGKDDGYIYFIGGGGTSDVNSSVQDPRDCDLGRVVSIAVRHQSDGLIGATVIGGVDPLAATGTEIYIACEKDGKFVVHRIFDQNASDGWLDIVNIAGSSPSGFNYDPFINGTNAMESKLDNIDDITVDHNGTVYIADNVERVVRKLLGNVLTTVAGVSTQGGGGDPAAPFDGNATRKMIGAVSLAMDYSDPAIWNPSSALFDTSLLGHLYIAGSALQGTGGQRIRKVTQPLDGMLGTISTMAGGGPSALPLPGETVFAKQADFGDRAPPPTIQEVAVDVRGNIFINTNDGAESTIWEVEQYFETAPDFPWTDGQIVYVVDTNASRASAWPGLPPYEMGLPTGMPAARFGPYWVNVDANASPYVNRFRLSASPIGDPDPVSYNSTWSSQPVGSPLNGVDFGDFADPINPLTNEQPFLASNTIVFDLPSTFYLVAGNSLDVSQFWTPNINIDLIKTQRVELENNASAELLVVDTVPGGSEGNYQVDFTFNEGPLYLTGDNSLEVGPGDYDPWYSGVVGVRDGTAGSLRMGLNVAPTAIDGSIPTYSHPDAPDSGFDSAHGGDNTFFFDTGTDHFGPLASVSQRYPLMHDATGPFNYSTVNFDVDNPDTPNEENSRDSRADVVCLLINSVTADPPNSPGQGYQYAKENRGSEMVGGLSFDPTKADPDEVTMYTTLGVEKGMHINVLKNRDSICFFVCAWDGALPFFTFPHELGHNLGAHHGVGDFANGAALNPKEAGDAYPASLQPNITFSPFPNNRITTPETTAAGGGLVLDSFLSCGVYFISRNSSADKLCTIMAYGGPRNNTGVYSRVGAFSGPPVVWQGADLAVGEGWLLPPPQGNFNSLIDFSNSRTLRTIGPFVSYYRDANGSGRAPPGQIVYPSPDRAGYYGEPRTPRLTIAPTRYAPGVGVVAARGGRSGARGTGSAAGIGDGGGRQIGGTNSVTTNQLIPGVTNPLIPGVTNPLIPGVTNPLIPGVTNPLIPGVTNPLIPGVTNPLIPGVTNPLIPGVTNPLIPGVVNPMPNPVLPNNHFLKPMQFPARAYAVLDAHNRGALEFPPKLGLPRTVWFKWTLPRNVSPGDKYEVTFSTKGSKFDTTMKVFFGEVFPSNPTMFHENDNAKTGPWSEVTLDGGMADNGQLYITRPKDNERIFFYDDTRNNRIIPISSLLVGVGGVDAAQGDIRISAQRKKK